MKKIFFTISTILAFTAIGFSQETPAPTPTPEPPPKYLDKTLSPAQRVQAALDVANSDVIEVKKYQALIVALSVRPVSEILKVSPQLVDNVLEDPTFKGSFSENYLSGALATAITTKSIMVITYDEKMKLYEKYVNDSRLISNIFLKDLKSSWVLSESDKLIKSGNTEKALSLLTENIGYTASTTLIQKITLTLIASNNPEALSWAKLYYYCTPFNSTQSGIDLVCKALKAIDLNIVRANAFIEFQKTGTGENPIKDVKLPTIKLPEDTNTVYLKYYINGNVDLIQALKVAAGRFGLAGSGVALNQATSEVAVALRNIDLNVVRANAYVEAQTKNSTFSITELK